MCTFVHLISLFYFDNYKGNKKGWMCKTISPFFLLFWIKKIWTQKKFYRTPIVALSFFYPVYKQLVYSSTRWLVHLPCYFVFYSPCLQATRSLVYLFTRLLSHFFAILFSYLLIFYYCCPIKINWKLCTSLSIGVVAVLLIHGLGFQF